MTSVDLEQYNSVCVGGVVSMVCVWWVRGMEYILF